MSSNKRGAGEGAIYQRESDGRWVGAVHLGWDGGRRRKVIYGSTRNAVSERMKALLREQQQGFALQSNDRLTVETFIRSWLTDTAKPRVKVAAFVTYESYINQHIIPNLGEVQLTKLTPQHVERMMARMLAEPTGPRQKGRARSPRTAAHARAVLRTALTDAVRWGMVARNAAALASAPRITEPTLAFLTPDHAREFVKGVAGLREEPIYVVALACGLRIGEVTGLAWEDVDLADGSLRVRQTLGRRSGEFVIGEPKSRNSRRTLALPAFAVTSLKAHRARQVAERLKAGGLWRNELDLLFTTEIGEPLNPSSLTRRFRGVLTELGLPQMRFHDLRHSCASLLIAEGVHPRIIMEQLGHSQISLTMNRYAHVAPVVQREVASRMDGLLGAG